MDVQFYGANCVVINYKGVRVVVDDTLAELGGKSVMRNDDLVLFTGKHEAPKIEAKLVIDNPGEYEVADVSILGVAAQAHIDEKGTKNATMFKVTVGDMNVLFTGHVDPNVSESQLEALGHVDVMIVPVGGNGYTLDAVGALKLIKEVEPKMVIPTHYADKALKFEVPQQDLDAALKELSLEVSQTVPKLKLKSSDLAEKAQVVVLEKS
jgi:L-ascorbate metabolism protein UlaG (beta-lactamase superfamily)